MQLFVLKIHTQENPLNNSSQKYDVTRLQQVISENSVEYFNGSINCYIAHGVRK